MFDFERDRDLLQVMGEATREESTCIAQRLLAVAELYTRHEGALADMEWCLVDYCAATAADVSAVQNISHARAVGQVQFACTLAHRLPAVAKVFVRGTIDLRMVSTIINRTDNVDEALMPQLDEAIAARCEKWMKLSRPKLRDRVDQWVAEYDPAAVRVPPKVEDNRYFDVDGAGPGMAFASAHLRAADAAALDARLQALADTVCESDPRSHAQRRADAAGALGRGETALACACGRQDCRADPSPGAAASAVIHVLAEHGTLEGTSDKPGYLRGFGILPAESVRELATTATLKPLRIPTGVTPDPGYRPSTRTREFLVWRDLTCRWPGCDKPVDKCDVDHTVPWPYGLTHPSNTKHYCRIHHLIKTFCGWKDRQLADGTIVLTSPTGYTVTTHAHGASMFPTLATPTGELDPPTHPPDPGPHRLAMMPRRKQTRAKDRQDRINAERRERTELIAEEQRQHQAWLAANYKPPPF
jgi:hypothetical protein